MIEHYQIWCLFFAHYCFFRVGSRHPLTCPNFLHTGMYTSRDVLLMIILNFLNQLPILFFFRLTGDAFKNGVAMQDTLRNYYNTMKHHK